jgi:hypothetical protein
MVPRLTISLSSFCCDLFLQPLFVGQDNAKNSHKEHGGTKITKEEGIGGYVMSSSVFYKLTYLISRVSGYFNRTTPQRGGDTPFLLFLGFLKPF